MRKMLLIAIIPPLVAITGCQNSELTQCKKELTITQQKLSDCEASAKDQEKLIKIMVDEAQSLNNQLSALQQQLEN